MDDCDHPAGPVAAWTVRLQCGRYHPHPAGHRPRGGRVSPRNRAASRLTGPDSGGAGHQLDAAPWIERVARAGYAAKGIVYLLIGVLAARAAFGDSGGQATGSSGALRSLTDEPFGQILLGIIAAGLLAYALWRAFSAVADPEDYGTDTKGIAVRAGFAVSAIVHGGLAREAYRLATGSGGGSSNGAEHWTSRLISAPFGPWLVGLAALVIGAYAAVQIYRAFAKDITKRLRIGGMDADKRRTIERLGRAGLAARGIVFGLIAWFLMQAALQYDPSEAGGVDQALRWLENQPGALFAAVALGLAAYGLFQLAKARYRVISAY